jgi:hypothetical protein
MQHRLEEVTALKTYLQGKLQAANVADNASLPRWHALQAELKNYLQTLTYQHPATSVDVAMDNYSLDPPCGVQSASFGACMDQDWAVHQQAHVRSCNAGRWSWQNMWTVRNMLQEEISADQAEMDFLQAEIPPLSCQCAHFTVMVQVVTTTSASAGGLTERSGRSLNGMNGIPIPIVLHEDGTFEGFGGGSDAGTARAQAGPLSANSQFGHQVFIRATGKIQPGDCTTKPCKPDMMHLVLDGVTSQQSEKAQVTGPGINMTVRNSTPGGGGVEEFDLPAYVGESARKTLLANGMINSQMTVMIVPAGSQLGGTASAAGASLLYSILECRLAKVLSPEGKPQSPRVGGGGGQGSDGGAGSRGGSIAGDTGHR